MSSFWKKNHLLLFDLINQCLEKLLQMLFCTHKWCASNADPGFSTWAPTIEFRAKTHYLARFLPKMKMKEIGLRGTTFPWHPLGSTNGKVWIFPYRRTAPFAAFKVFGQKWKFLNNTEKCSFYLAITSNNLSFRCPVIYTDTNRSAILFIDTSTMLDTTKLIQ